MADHTAARMVMQDQRRRLDGVYKNALTLHPPIRVPSHRLPAYIRNCGKNSVYLFTGASGPFKCFPGCGSLGCAKCRSRSGSPAYRLAVDHLVHTERLLQRHGPTAWVADVAADSRLRLVGRKIAAADGSRVFCALTGQPGKSLVISSHRAMVNVKDWDPSRVEGDFPMREVPVTEAIEMLAAAIARGLRKAPSYRKSQAVVRSVGGSDSLLLGTEVASDLVGITRGDKGLVLSPIELRGAWSQTLRWFTEHDLGDPAKHEAQVVFMPFAMFSGIYTGDGLPGVPTASHVEFVRWYKDVILGLPNQAGFVEPIPTSRKEEKNLPRNRYGSDNLGAGLPNTDPPTPQAIRSLDGASRPGHTETNAEALPASEDAVAVAVRCQGER